MKLALLAAAAAAVPATAQEQIHLSLTGIPSEMEVSWAYVLNSSSSDDDNVTGCNPSSVTYGAGSNTKTATGKLHKKLDSICLYSATMTGLAPNTQYTYSVDSGSSFTFTPQPTREGGKIYAVLADFGNDNDVSMGQLVTEATNGQFDAIIHAGDFAYDLDDEYGKTGNEFMNSMQPAAAIMPYMGCPGNHEAVYSEGSYNFDHYKYRFAAYNTTAANSKSKNQFWYSFDDGLVHWVSIFTEGYYGASASELKDQIDWLKADLAAVDRSKTPWVMGLGHKQDWMDKVDFTTLESTLQGHVDMYFCGHQHDYQRLQAQNAGVVENDCMSPDNSVYNQCQNMVTIVVGSPGCKEGLSELQAPQGIANFINNVYGYGHLQIMNSTHASWGWEQVGQRDEKGRFLKTEGSFTDSATIIRANRS